MASQNVVELTDSNFQQEVLEAQTPVLVDFGAEWCMPCKMIEPTIEELADENAGRIKIGKIDTEASREVAMKFSISAIPTLILFKDSKPVKQLVGLQQKADIQAAIDEVVDQETVG